MQIDDHVFLRWTIKSGNTCTGTRIEHSTGGTGFLKIGEISGICGSPDQPTTYEYIDSMPVPNRMNYYRLEMSLLGYSSPVIVEVIFLNDGGYSIQPNPVVSQSRLVFDNPDNEAFEFCLIDQQGRQVVNKFTNNNYVIIDRNLIRSGMYIFKILKDNSIRIKGKVVVM